MPGIPAVARTVIIGFVIRQESRPCRGPFMTDLSEDSRLVTRLRGCPSPRGHGRDEHAVDAVGVHVHDLEPQVVPYEVIAGTRYAAELRKYEARERLVARFLLLGQPRDVERLLELVHR